MQQPRSLSRQVNEKQDRETAATPTTRKEIAMQVQPYLFFDGRCDEALDFYKKTVGADVKMLMRFKDSPDPAMCTGASADKVMHAQFQIGDTAVLASDGRCQGQPKFDGFALAISAKSEADADKMFAALGDGGQVTMPMAKTFFSPRFGMLADKFGVQWMILVPQ
jgi:PhnB protein